MYLIEHNFEPSIKNGELVFTRVAPIPGVGEVTSITNKKYIVGPRGNLIKITG